MALNKTIVIYQQYGGLGDNLQYSTLPELYSKQGYDVYIHTNNVVVIFIKFKFIFHVIERMF